MPFIRSQLNCLVFLLAFLLSINYIYNIVVKLYDLCCSWILITQQLFRKKITMSWKIRWSLFGLILLNTLLYFLYRYGYQAIFIKIILDRSQFTRTLINRVTAWSIFIFYPSKIYTRKNERMVLYIVTEIS